MFKFFSYLRYAQRSNQWKNVRKKHLEEQNSCQACGSDKNLEVHHIIPVHVDKDRELDPNNLITLCNNNCHLLFGHLMHFKSWNPLVAEDCQRLQQKILKRKDTK